MWISRRFGAQMGSIGMHIELVGRCREVVLPWYDYLPLLRGATEEANDFIQTVLIALVSVFTHARYAQYHPYCDGILKDCDHRHYTCPAEQRQMYVIIHDIRFAFLTLYYSLRIIYMPPIYAVISFLSYRFFRSYTYYEFAEVGALLVFYVA